MVSFVTKAMNFISICLYFWHLIIFYAPGNLVSVVDQALYIFCIKLLQIYCDSRRVFVSSLLTVYHPSPVLWLFPFLLPFHIIFHKLEMCLSPSMSMKLEWEIS